MQSVGLFCRGRHVFQRFRQFSIRTLSFTSRRRQPEPECENEKEDKKEDEDVKVTVLGAAGRVGRTLSLLLKTCPLVDRLCLFDVNKTVRGITADLSHVDTKCNVTNVCGMSNIEEALQEPKVVLIAAGYPITPNMKGRRLFEKNAPVVAGLAEACAIYCPQAFVVLITSPVNSLLPVAAEIYKAVTGQIPGNRLFGLTTLDVIRANTYAAEITNQDPNKVIVPVIGGSSRDTIVPVLSQIKPYCKIKQEETIALTECVKNAEANLLDCQYCGTFGSSSLSTAYAAFRFATCLISGLKGDKDIVECAYVRSGIIPELEYLASPLKLGREGVEFNFGYPNLSDYEVSLMENAAPILKSEIELGKAYVRNFLNKQEEKHLPCYCKSEEPFMSRKPEIIKRQERRFGTCKPNEEPKTNPQFLDSILKPDNVVYNKEIVDVTSEIQEISKTKEIEKSEKIFKFISKKIKKRSKNLIETEKKCSKSKRFRSKKEECREEGNSILPSSKCEAGFPWFLASRVSVPLTRDYDAIEYCEVNNPPLNVFSVALYFFCFIVMYLFMSFRL